MDDNDWSFKDKTLPWNEVSVITLWDEKAVLEIEMSGETDVDTLIQGELPEWKEADIIDSAWFEDASFYSDEASFYAHDDSSRYSQDDDDECDALEEYLKSFFNETSRSTYDDASYYPEGNDKSCYFDDYTRYEINFNDDSDASEDEVVVSPAMFDATL